MNPYQSTYGLYEKLSLFALFLLTIVMYSFIFYEVNKVTVRYVPYKSHIMLKSQNNSSTRKYRFMSPRTYHYDGQLLLYVAIFTAASFPERRQAIRETWLRDCERHGNVMCKFFTDRLDARGNVTDSETIRKLEDESSRNGNDLVLVDSMAGRNFALRYLVVLEYAMKFTDFTFFLRIDDDQFPCIDRLVAELPKRPSFGLYWGWQHCHRGIVRIDEGWMMISSDIADNFLLNRNDLLCHKSGDIAFAMWIYDIMKKKRITWFADNKRIHHDPPASKHMKFFMNRKEICRTYISIHGLGPNDMRNISEVLERERTSVKKKYSIPPIIDRCPYRKSVFRWQIFGPPFYAVPKPCKDNPTWSGDAVYKGRQG